jgi:hypothetical protein
MWRHAVWHIFANVSEEPVASIFTAEKLQGNKTEEEGNTGERVDSTALQMATSPDTILQPASTKAGIWDGTPQL